MVLYLFFLPESLHCFHFLLFLMSLIFSLQAIKTRLWLKQKGSTKSKDEAPKVEKVAKPQAPAVACAIPRLTEAERMRQSPFERLVYDMAHNEKVVNDLMLGRRVGFYELRGEIGQGNFSTVKLGIHALTKGLNSYLSGFISFMHSFFFCFPSASLKSQTNIALKLKATGPI